MVNLLRTQLCFQAKRVFADRHGYVPIYGHLDEQSAIFFSIQVACKNAIKQSPRMRL
jgi:hypothetical protein